MSGREGRGIGKWTRRILKLALVLVLLLALVVALLPWLARPMLSGALTAALGRRVAIGALRWDTADLSVVADDVHVGSPPEEIVVRRISVAADPRGSSRRQLVIQRIAVEEPRGSIVVDEFLAADADEEKAKPPPLPLGIAVREIVVTDAALDLRPPYALEAKVAVVLTEAKAVDVALGTGRTLQLTGSLAGTVDGAPLQGKAEVQLAGEERRITGAITVKKLALRPKTLPLPPDFAALSGTLDATATLAIGEKPGRSEVRVEARLAKMRLDHPSLGRITAGAVSAPAARIDLTEHRVELGAVDVRDAALTVDLAAAPPAASATPSEKPKWGVRSGAVSVRGGELRLRRGEATTSLRLDRVRWDGLRDAAVPLSFTGTAADGGSIAVEGAVRVDPLTAELEVRASDLAAPPWARLLDLPLQLRRGSVGGTATVVYRDGLRSIAGELRGNDLHTLPPDPARPIEVMAAATAVAAFSYTPGDPAAVEVSSASLDFPYAMVVRSEQGTFPYSLLGAGGGAGDTEAAGGGTRTTLHVGRVGVTNGKLEFVDDTLQPPFWTSLTDMTASAEDVAVPPGTIERFALAAKRDEISPITLSGSFTGEGLGGRVEVTDVLLDSLNPYIAPRLGYRVTAGRLSTVATARPQPPLLISAADLTLNGVDVMQTGTDVILEQSGVPLPIALGLIADAGGQIELKLPFSIDTTSGDVAVGSVVWQAIRKAIVTALTSPLRILGSLFGDKGAPHAFAVDPIPFTAGSATLDAAGRQRINEIARIVHAHQGLLLVLLPQLTAADVAAVGAGSGAAALARDRNDTTRSAFIVTGLPPKRILLADWDPEKAAKATDRPGVYVELQDAE